MHPYLNKHSIKKKGNKKPEGQTSTDMEKEQVWLPLQTVYNKELTVAAYLKEQGIEHYIPMTYELRDTGREGECSHVLVPAIHNLIFIHCPYDAN